jgi:hypothetical protein
MVPAVQSQRRAGIGASLASLDDDDPLDRAGTIKIEMHACARANLARVDCFASLVHEANFLAENIRYWPNVGRGLHNDRRGRENNGFGRRE